MSTWSLPFNRTDGIAHNVANSRLDRVRFLLADDPGAGKTIMAGLLLKELKIRGLVKRTLIITPASLSFQWQREMKEKFREQFEVIRSDVLRANYGMNPWQERNQVSALVRNFALCSAIGRMQRKAARWFATCPSRSHKRWEYRRGLGSAGKPC